MVYFQDFLAISCFMGETDLASEGINFVGAMLVGFYSCCFIGFSILLYTIFFKPSTKIISQYSIEG
jgi:hypothetical protein